VTTCALAVILRTVIYGTEPPYVENSQAFLEAATEVGFGGREQRAQRI
jgi:hypothetical protein